MPLLSRICVIVSTFFGVGYLPLIPGTFGALAGLVLVYFLQANLPAYLAGTVIFTIIGFLCSGVAERALGTKDCRYIVIDEVSGIFVTMLFLPQGLKMLALGFILFRILDTLKPFPAGPIQRIRGSGGIMGDDLVAGLYANLILQVALRCTSFIGS
jgi:phosphatidylglycerophosphatase A